jgi:acyl-CoA thioesterase I
MRLWVVRLFFLNITLLFFIVQVSFVSVEPASAEGIRAESPPPKILVLGDSLSAAYGIQVEQGWVSLLEARLSKKFPYRVINASVSGETTGGGLARLPALLKEHHPQIVLVELGGNDGLRGHPTPLIQQQLSEIVQLSVMASAKVLLIGIEIPPNYGPKYTNLFRAVYVKVAEQHQIPLVPFLLNNVAVHKHLMQQDGIHPNAEAQPALLENVWGYLDVML